MSPKISGYELKRISIRKLRPIGEKPGSKNPLGEKQQKRKGKREKQQKRKGKREKQRMYVKRHFYTKMPIKTNPIYALINNIINLLTTR